MSDWHHAPPHRFQDAKSVYFVTGATYGRKHIFCSRDRLNSLRSRLFVQAEKHECWLQAWSLFPNHYHLVASADGEQLHAMLSRLHSESAIEMNQIDETAGRKVWFSFARRN